MKIRSFLFLLFTLLSTAFYGQEVRVSCLNCTVDKALRDLKVEVSFDAAALSRFKTSISYNFSSVKMAVDSILSSTPYNCEMIGDVYVIVLKEEVLPQEVPPSPKYSLVGVVVDGKSGEPLPYALVGCNETGSYTNSNGVFSLIVTEQNVHLKTFYLGYQSVDTSVAVQNNVIIKLNSVNVELKPIEVASVSAPLRMQQGDFAGQMRLNPIVSKYFASNGDNAVYTLLHLMPGVRASGEPTGDLFIWGSGTGESRVVFDGMPLYGLQNYNDQIGLVNPFLVKDIRLHKSGSDASFGGAVGGIGEIVGANGSGDKPSFKVNMNNKTVNLLGSLPLGKRSSLLLGYRQTYYNLFSDELLNPYKKDSSVIGTDTLQRVKLTVVPDYSFRDFNLKFNHNFDELSSLYFSILGSEDRFDYTLTNFKRVNLEESNKQNQFGFAGGLHKVWSNDGISEFKFRYTNFKRSEDKISGLLALGNTYFAISNTLNSIKEVGAEVNHQIKLNAYNSLKGGLVSTWYMSGLNEVSTSLYSPTLFLSDTYSKERVSVTFGARLDAPNTKLFAFQPRFNLGYALSKSVKFTFGAGRFYQMVQHAPIKDRAGAFQLAWITASGDYIPALVSNQFVAGLNYSGSNAIVSFESYVKKTTGVVALNKASQQVVSSTVDSKMFGGDLFMRYNIWRVGLFGSASLCQQAILTTVFQEEYKGGALINYSPFHISLNYVWGRGFNYLGTASYSDRPFYTAQFNEIYKRLDGAITYKRTMPFVDLELGIVVLNILDANNLKYRYQVPPSKLISGSVSNLFLESVGFTPTLFIELSF